MMQNREWRLGNYSVSRVLGSGGFATVYYGEHIYLKTPAAIKVLNLHITAQEQEKFLQEARIAVRLEHPNIISVLEFGIEQDVPYLVMDYASRGMLRQHYPRDARLPLREVVSYVRQVSSALQYTHEQNVIHRDIKPENMLLSGSGHILLSDFGIAFAVESVQKGSNDRHLVGTVLYMAPEQICGEPVPASDQYALAAVVYEWLSGSPPFSGSYTEVAVQHALIPPVPLRQRVPELSASVEEVLMIALAKEPEARFKSVKAFGDAFVHACETPQTSRSMPAKTGISSMEQPREALSVSQSPDRTSRRRFVMVGALGGVGLAAAGALWWKPLWNELHGLASPQAVHPITKESAPTTPPTAGTTLYTSHGQELIVSLAWLVGSKRIVSAGTDVQIWDALTGMHNLVYYVGRFSNAQGNFTNTINQMAVSPNGKYIAIAIEGNNTEIQVWDALTGKPLYTFPIKTFSSVALAWSPDSQSLAIATDTTTGIQLYDALSGRQLLAYSSQADTISCIAWSPDGKLIASASGGANIDLSGPGSIHIWESATGQTQMIYHGHPDYITAVAWSPQGTTLASAGGTAARKNDSASNTVQVWSPENGKPMLVYRGHTDGPVTTVSWSPNGRSIVSGSGMFDSNIEAAGSTTVLIWDVQSGKTLLNYQGHNHTAESGVSNVTWSPDGTLIASAGSIDNTIQVWKALPATR